MKSVGTRSAPLVRTNTQPYRLRIIDDQEAEVIFLPRRGLYVAEPLGRFTWLTGGVFIAIIGAGMFVSK